MSAIINKFAGSNNGSDCSANTGLPVLAWQALYSSHKSENIVRKTVQIVSPSAQKCIDNFPPPLLLSVPRDNGLVARKTGCPLCPNLIIIDSATLSHSPCVCQCKWNTTSFLIQVRGMTIFLVKIISHKSKRVWRLIRIPVHCLWIPMRCR